MHDHFRDRAHAEPVDGRALGVGQRRPEYDRVRLQDSQWQRDNHTLRLVHFLAGVNFHGAHRIPIDALDGSVETDIQVLRQRGRERAKSSGEHAVAVAIDLVAVIPAKKGQRLFVRRTVVARRQGDVPLDGLTVGLSKVAAGQDGVERIVNRAVRGAVVPQAAPAVCVELVPHLIGDQDAAQFVCCGELLPARAIQHEVVPAARVGAVASHKQRPDAELAGEIGDRIPLGSMDPMGAVIDAVGGVAAAADAAARLEHRNRHPPLCERARGTESCQAGADHQHAAAPVAAAAVGRQPTAQAFVRHLSE
jgi:hypothetical protein